MYFGYTGAKLRKKEGKIKFLWFPQLLVVDFSLFLFFHKIFFD